MAESEKNEAPSDTDEREAEAYRDFLLEEGDDKATLEQVPHISREDLKDTRRLSVDDMRKLADEKD